MQTHTKLIFHINLCKNINVWTVKVFICTSFIERKIKIYIYPAISENSKATNEPWIFKLNISRETDKLCSVFRPKTLHKMLKEKKHIIL